MQCPNIRIQASPIDRWFSCMVNQQLRAWTYIFWELIGSGKPVHNVSSNPHLINLKMPLRIKQLHSPFWSMRDEQHLDIQWVIGVRWEKKQKHQEQNIRHSLQVHRVLQGPNTNDRELASRGWLLPP